VKRKTAPLMAILLLSSGFASLAPVWCQGLPPVVMGKTVKQPGDNQYMPQAQLDRHGNYVDRTGTNSSVFISKPGGGGGPVGGGGMIQAGGVTINPMILMYSPAPKVDVTLEPISTDEPVPPAGFPPLPDRIQLPVALGAPSSGGGSGGSWSSGGGGGGSNGGGGGGGSGGGGNGGFEGVHQHYIHMAPGSYQNGGGGGGNGGGGGGGGGGANYAADPNAAVPGFNPNSGGGGTHTGATSANPGVLPPHGYYKVNTQSSPMTSIKTGGGDTFNSNDAGGAPPRYTGASSKDLQKMGQAPKLDDKQDENAGAPEAPQAAIVSQSQAQDLSLPDDEFVSRQGLKDSSGKRAAKTAAQRMGQLLYQGVNMGVSRAYSLVP
jgi:hypothetical protein